MSNLNFFITNILFIWFLIPCSALAQGEETKLLKVDDYTTWSRIGLQHFSPNGKWMSFNVFNDEGKDILFLKNTTTGKLYSFVNSISSTFGKKRKFVVKLSNDSIAILDLEKGTLRKKHANDFIILDKDYLLLVTPNDKGNTITIENEHGKEVFIERDIKTFKSSPSGKSLVYSIPDEVRFINLEARIKPQTIQKKENYILHTITWGKNPENIVLTGIDFTREQVITLYNSHTKSIYNFLPEQELPGGDSLSVKIVNSNSVICSDDGKRIFIPIIKKHSSNQPKEPDIKVWNSKDKQLKPYTALHGKLGGRGLWVWEPEKNTGKLVGWEDEGITSLNGNQKFVLSYDSAPYLPSLKYSPDRDIYITNLIEGTRSLFLEKQPYENSNIAMSPDGKYAIYFRDQNWWCYNFKMQTHQNLTQNKTTSFADESNDKPQLASPYSIAGWDTTNNLILYDKFDIWKVNTHNKTMIRLTKGREKKRVYRISKTIDAEAARSSSFVRTIPIIDWNKPLLLETLSTNNASAGLVVLINGKEIKELYSTEAKLSNIIKAKQSDYIVFTRERFDTPPEIMWGNLNQNIFKSIFKSNCQIAKYNWGKSELLTWKDTLVDNGSAVLFYPANFNSQEKYPMIVHIYEDQEDSLHQFVNPSLHNEKWLQ